ncbi:unnamed protein product [Lampetra fluviatilis]
MAMLRNSRRQFCSVGDGVQTAPPGGWRIARGGHPRLGRGLDPAAADGSRSMTCGARGGRCVEVRGARWWSGGWRSVSGYRRLAVPDGGVTTAVPPLSSPRSRCQLPRSNSVLSLSTAEATRPLVQRSNSLSSRRDDEEEEEEEDDEEEEGEEEGENGGAGGGRSESPSRCRAPSLRPFSPRAAPSTVMPPPPAPPGASGEPGDAGGPSPRLPFRVTYV